MSFASKILNSSKGMEICESAQNKYSFLPKDYDISEQ